MSTATAARYDVAVVGAGFSGMYMLHLLREQGLSVRVFESGDDVGGTWYWNRYPGARCDVESMFYSYSFSPELEQEWEWTERYPTQPEILRYAQHVADRFDLRRDICFETRVVSAVFDEDRAVWTVTTDAGDVVEAQFVVTAVGCLSTAQSPRLPGLEDFQGQTLHTGHWPHEGVELAGRRVGVIGTGSSGIQAIPVIAEQAEHLTVFQRTPNFTIPAHNRPLDPAEVASIRAQYPALREAARRSPGGSETNTLEQGALELSEQDRLAELERRWEVGGATFVAAFPDAMVDLGANAVVADFVRGKIAQIVEDPDVANRLSPTTYPIGTKRICVDTDYYATFNRDNVDLVDLRDAPIESVTSDGVRVGGVVHEVDTLVFATGYDAMTGSLTRMGIVGRGGLTLAEAWEHGPHTYLGVAVAGFPNLFTITGPGSPSVLSNMMVSIEQHVEWISNLVAHARSEGLSVVEAQSSAQVKWVEHVNEVANYTLYPHAASWYLGANVPGKTRVFMPYVGGVGAYRQRCEQVAAAGYEGFSLLRADQSADALVTATSHQS